MLDTEIEGSSEGRVQFCYDNTYGTICDDFWDIFEARVVCGQLGFTGASMFIESLDTLQLLIL